MFWQKTVSPAPAVLRRVTFCGDKKSPKSALPSLVRYADTLTLQSVRGFADGTSVYRGERSSSLTRPLRGLFLTALQGSAATQGMEIHNIETHSGWLNVSLTRRGLIGIFLIVVPYSSLQGRIDFPPLVKPSSARKIRTSEPSCSSWFC